MFMRLWLADIKGESEEAMLALLAVLMWLQLNGGIRERNSHCVALIVTDTVSIQSGFFHRGGDNNGKRRARGEKRTKCGDFGSSKLSRNVGGDN